LLLSSRRSEKGKRRKGEKGGGSPGWASFLISVPLLEGRKKGGKEGRKPDPSAFFFPRRRCFWRGKKKKRKKGKPGDDLLRESSEREGSHFVACYLCQLRLRRKRGRGGEEREEMSFSILFARFRSTSFGEKKKKGRFFRLLWKEKKKRQSGPGSSRGIKGGEGRGKKERSARSVLNTSLAEAKGEKNKKKGKIS